MRCGSRVEAMGGRPSGVQIGRCQFLRNVPTQCDDGGCQRVRQAHCLPRQIYVLQLLAHCVAHCGLLVRWQLLERFAELRLRNPRLDQSRKPDKCPCRIVLAVVRPHAVQAAEIHQIRFLESGLARQDVVRRHQQGATGVHEAFRLRWSTFVGEESGPAQQSECDHCDSQQDPL